MKINAKFTKKPIRNNFSSLRGGCKIVDKDGAVMCFLFRGKLYDLNHVCFASCKRVDDIADVDDSDAFVTDGKFLYRQGQAEGRLVNNTFKIVVTLLVILLLLATLSLVIVANVIKKPTKPDFTVVDINGKWGEIERINIFGNDKIKPGDSGKYSFMVNNVNDYDLNCLLRIKFNNEENALRPNIVYKLETGGKYLTFSEKDDYMEVCDVKIYKNESRSFYLEWEWAFDVGNDDYDTTVGVLGNAYTVTIEIVAEKG